MFQRFMVSQIRIYDLHINKLKFVTIENVVKPQSKMPSKVCPTETVAAFPPSILQFIFGTIGARPCRFHSVSGERTLGTLKLWNF